MKPDFGVEITKFYAPRGPLQQYRVAAPQTFACSRCAAEKTSKLLTTVDGREDRLVCNGCYGRLLALWDIKAGDLPDADRDEAILQLLQASITVEEVQEAQRRLAATRRHLQLSIPAQQMLATAEAVTGALRAATGLDWSAAVIGLCKAVEVEVVTRLAKPLRHATVGMDLSADLADDQLQRVARYCVGRSPAPELGTWTHTLTVAATSKRRASNSQLVQALGTVAARGRDGDWIKSPDGLSRVLNVLTKRYRNPAAHTEILNEQDYNSCRELVVGDGGILDRLLHSTC